MAWYWIVLIVLFTLLCLLFLAYMTNADMKLIEKLYDALIKYHDSKTVEEKSDMSQRRCLKTAERLLRGSAFNDIRSTRKG